MKSGGGVVWLGTSFSGLGSQFERCTAAAHSLDDGRADPGGSVFDRSMASPLAEGTADADDDVAAGAVDAGS